ncbi:cilia- and flagella-associated protein 100-like isoform X2 [Lytechinus variegatus]|uniref:cilia- and flagella-associated protein 100-like isoform X2 n=1 Tax=Lytechinus variegatus TaxID=7654 RepID=UPI001BB12042|nr:cilia- and flagella-associated protein 100-like isoform X2 [Lytechinus variegatus]
MSGSGSPARSPSPSQSPNSGQDIVSRQSGRVTFPQSIKSASQNSVITEDEEMPADFNPFTMPADNDIFMLRDKERQRKKAERIKQRGLKVHEKTTYTSRVNALRASMRRPLDELDAEEDDEAGDEKALAVKDDPSFTIAVTRDRHVEKESLPDYIAKKREMFLVQYSLGVKRDEMRKLEEIASAEERKLELAEQYLEEDAAMFDEFLKENDKNSVEAIKIAEAETKAKMEKVQEIRKINEEIGRIRGEISKNEVLLKDYQLYKKFLDSLTPAEWKEENRTQRMEKRKLKNKDREKLTSASRKKVSSASTEGRNSRSSMSKGLGKASSRGSAVKRATIQSPAKSEDEARPADDDSDYESDEEPELFFSDPQQLLDIFADLEEQNLSLIQNSQETEENLEEIKQTITSTETRMDRETEILKQQIDMLKHAIDREEEKAKDLEHKSKMFSFGEFKAEDQGSTSAANKSSAGRSVDSPSSTEAMLDTLNNKVEEVYANCIGDNEANISTLQMLTNIENKLEELFESIETMPPEKVEAAEKAKEKERRLRLREEKLEAQRIHQEERVRRALERAQADPKKKTGRKLVYRSEPPQTKRKVDRSKEKANKEEEEMAYFFT